jgi:hypothetical protein
LPFRSAIFDAAALDADHVHAVGVQDHQRLQRDLVALELVLAAEGVLAGVGHREADVGLAAADQLEVVDRTAGDFGRGLHARHVLGQHRRDAAAHRVVDPARATGGDGQVLRESARAEQRSRGGEGAAYLEGLEHGVSLRRHSGPVFGPWGASLLKSGPRGQTGRLACHKHAR